MTDLQLTTALETIAAVLLASWVLFKLLASSREDNFRQQMFALRDELFDYAAAGNISFDNPAYRLLRDLMNGFIRYAHQLTVFRCIMSHAIRRVNGGPQDLVWHERWDSAVSKLDNPKNKQEIGHFHNRAVTLVVMHLIWGSPTIWLALLCAAGGVLAQHGFVSLRLLWRRSRTKVEYGIIDLRRIEEDAVLDYAQAA